MSEDRQTLYSTLEIARSELQQAQSRVAELEARLSGEDFPPSPSHSTEKRYHATFDHMLEGCQIIGFDWRYIYVNDTASRYGRQSQADLLGYTLQERYPGIEDTELFAALRHCLEHRAAQDAEFEFIYPDGTSAWFEFRIQPIPEGIIILTLDITERKQLEAAATEKVEQLKLFVAHAPAAIAMLDREMKYILVSQRWLLDYRLRERDIIGRSHYDIFPDLPERWKEIHQRCLAGAVERNEADPFPRADGSIDWVRWEIRPWRDLNGEIGGILILSEVITERVQAEAAIQRYAHRLEILHQIDLALIRGDSIQALVEATLSHIRQLIPCQQASVILFDTETSEVIIFATDQNTPSALVTGNRVPMPPDTHEEFGTNTISRIDILEELPESSAIYQRLKMVDMRASLRVALRFQDQPIGRLILNADTSHFFTAEHQEIAVEIGRQLAIAIHQLHLAEELAHHAALLEARVTERTVELQAAKERVEAILNNSVDGILLATADLYIQQTNSAFRRMFGCDFDDCYDQPLSSLVHPDESAAFIDAFRVGAANALMQHVEIRAVRKDGRIFDAEFSVGYITNGGLVCVIRDITERKARERQLHFHASLQENVSDAVIVTDTEFHIQSWNRAAERIYGWSAEEAIGKATTEILRTEYAASNELGQLIDDFKEKGWWQGEVVQRHKDGSTRHILGSVTLVKDEKGIPFGIVAINHDITQRKQAEEALRESETRYYEMFEYNKAVKFVIDPQTGAIVEANAAACEYYGYSRDTLKAMHITDINTLPSETIFSKMKLAGSKASTVFEFRHRLASGEIRDVEVYSGPIQINGRPLLHSIVVDITERKRAERALQAYAEEIQDLYDNAPCGYHSIDKDGLIVQINDTELRWLGYSRDEVVNRLKITDIFTPESVRTFQKWFPLFKERGSISDLEFDAIRRDGSIIRILLNGIAIYDDKGQYVRSRSSLFDITELKQAQKALVESETRYRLLAENVTDVIAKINSSGIRTFITPSCYALLGYMPEELIGKPAAEILHPDDIAPSMMAMKQAVETGQTAITVTQRLCAKDGHYIWVEVTSSIVRDPATGDAVEAIGVIRDISERKRAEDVLRARMDEEHEFQAYLKALHDITIELTQTDNLDMFFRRVIELGLERFGFDRLALFLYDPITGIATGTYGTNPEGQITDEHHISFAPNPNGIMIRALERAERFHFDTDVPLFKDMQPVGRGWNAASVLWDGTRSLGWLIADNLRTQKPATKPLLDTLSLYALSVGTVLARKRTIEELRNSEARYRVLAENITDVVLRANAQGELLYVSPSIRSVLGYEPEELLGQVTLEFVHPDDVDSATEAFTSTVNKTHSYVSMVARFRHKQGNYVWLETIGRTIRSETTSEIVEFLTSSRDISDRMRAEEALRESEEKFRRLVDAAPVATVISDQSGRIVLINIQAESLFGYHRMELDGQLVEVLVPDYARESHLHKRAHYFAEPRVRPMGSGLQLFARRKDGSNFPVEIELSYIQTPTGILVMSFVVDITERKRIAAEMERQRAFLQKVIDLSPSLIFVKDGNARFVLANPMVARTYNSTVEALIGKTDSDFNPSQQEADDFLRADRHVIETGEPLFIEEPITSFSGETRWLQTTKVPITGEDGSQNYVLGVSTDITERRQAEESLRQAFEKERELSELKSRFVSMASHEFRTPLASILALTETLSAYRHKLPDEQIEQRLQKIRAQVGHLKDIMEDVLLLARMQARRVDFNPVKLNIDALCRSVVDEFTDRPEIGNRLTYQYQGKGEDVTLDRKLMRQVISNLISNAIKYSPVDKPVSVRLECRPDTVLLEVQDKGIGIPETDIKHLYEPFHRAANVGTISGTGLGLVIAKESVDLHGGTITVDSQLGAGTTFTVSIPTKVESSIHNDENSGD